MIKFFIKSAILAALLLSVHAYGQMMGMMQG